MLRRIGNQIKYNCLVCKITGKRLRGGAFPRNIFTHTYDDIICVENLLSAWTEFIRGKRKKADVQEFQHYLMSNILSLHHELKNEAYKHGGYQYFVVTDPKRRDIHKADVRDRLVHHAIYRILYPYYDKRFILDSYSCRNNKGTHRAMNQFRVMAGKASHNHTKTVWILKCDIRKFFASIDQSILIQILEKQITETKIINLLKIVTTSFHSTKIGKGLPLGNLTSQLLVNIYMNEFDQFIKHKIKVKHYIRYADDFMVLETDRNKLKTTLSYMIVWLRAELDLELHPYKVSITTYSSGVDFLGWVHFPTHLVLRTVTRKRIEHSLSKKSEMDNVVASYLGLLKHGNAYNLRRELLEGLDIAQ